MAMADFLRDCNSGDLKTDPKSFQEVWCIRCSRVECNLAGFVQNDPMAIRNATWRERFFGTPEANLSLPKYAQIAQVDFPNLLQKAMKLEISARRGDWSVPEIPVLDGQVLSAPQDITNHVDAAARSLAGASGRPFLGMDPDDEDGDPDESPEDDEYIEDEEVPAEEPLPPVPVRAQAPAPPRRNTPDPGDVMIGGAPAEVQRSRPATETDPWAPAPKATTVVVKTGARVQFGAGGKAKVVDG